MGAQGAGGAPVKSPVFSEQHLETAPPGGSAGCAISISVLPSHNRPVQAGLWNRGFTQSLKAASTCSRRRKVVEQCLLMLV